MPCLSDAGVRGSSALGTPGRAFPQSLSLSAQVFTNRSSAGGPPRLSKRLRWPTKHLPQLQLRYFKVIMGQTVSPCYPSTEPNLLDLNQERDEGEMLPHPPSQGSQKRASSFPGPGISGGIRWGLC